MGMALNQSTVDTHNRGARARLAAALKQAGDDQGSLVPVLERQRDDSGWRQGEGRETGTKL